MHISRACELSSFRSCVDQISSVGQVFLVAMDTAHSRFSGSTERLATPWGSQFLVRDPATGKEPQLQPHLLLKHTQMLHQLHELQPNLAFKQTQAIAVLTKRHLHGRFNDETFCKDIITTNVNLTTKRPLGYDGGRVTNVWFEQGTHMRWSR